MGKMHSRSFSVMFYALLLLALAGLCGCGGGGDSAVPASTESKVLQSITIEPSSVEVAADTPVEFTAYGLYSGSTTPVDISGLVEWSNNSSTALAFTTVNGKTYISSSADITITATKDLKSGTATLTVTPPPS